MQETKTNWEMLAKAIDQKQQELGRQLSDAERREIEEAMQRHGCDPEYGWIG